MISVDLCELWFPLITVLFFLIRFYDFWSFFLSSPILAICSNFYLTWYYQDTWTPRSSFIYMQKQTNNGQMNASIQEKIFLVNKATEKQENVNTSHSTRSFVCCKLFNNVIWSHLLNVLKKCLNLIVKGTQWEYFELFFSMCKITLKLKENLKIILYKERKTPKR